MFWHTEITLISHSKFGQLATKIHQSKLKWLSTLAISFFAMPSFAAPIAVDDNVAVLSNTPVLANDLAANDTSLSTDIFTITIPPTNGVARLTSDGQLDYFPNIGFASTDTLTYSIDDGAGGVDTATVTFDVVLTSDFLTPGNNFIVGQEDIPTPLNLTVDESLENGGTLQDIIAVDALYRASDLGGTAVASTIPTGTTGIKITGYATRSVDTTQVDSYNDDYELLTINVDLREGTYSGRLTYSTNPSSNFIDQYTWLNVPLGQSALSDTSYASGNWTEDANGDKTADILVELIAGQISITETNPLQIAYHVEHMTADGDSADFISASGAVQAPGEFISTFDIPSELEPTDGSAHGYLVLTGNSAADGANFAMEHKGFSRMVVNLETNTVSGVIASERGELDSIVTTWAFTDYSLVDLRDTPTTIPVSITASTVSIVGDNTAPGSGSEDDPTIYIDATGQLTIERATDHSNAFTTMYTIENYRRTGLSSIASFVGVVSDTSLFDSAPTDDIDDDGKLVNLQTFAIPASASIGLVEMSWQTIGGTESNENVGYGFAVIDLNDNSSSGSITFSRSTTPDLVAWQGVPIGTTMFGATDGGVDLYQSNKASNSFTDYYPATATFTLVDNADGSRNLTFTATNIGPGTFRDYIGTTQVSWLGSEPFSIQGVPASGTLSHGSPTDNGGWEVDFADIPNLTISTNEHGTGELQLDLILASTGELDSIIVHVEPVVDDPKFEASDVVGYAENPVLLGISIGDSADVDGSETQLETLTLSGVPTDVTLSASAGIVTNFGGGNWQVDNAALATLAATGPVTSTTTVTATGTNIDTDDLDGDGVIEDVNNGAGVDELDSVTYTFKFELTILEVPTVASQETNTGTPIISGTATIGTDESLLVTVNGITYTNGDGNLVVNGDGTWDLTIPGSDTIADGTYVVTASINHINGGTGVDTTTNELIIDATPPVTPVVMPLTTSDATPTIIGKAIVNANEVLAVTVNGITYTAGDGNLIDNGDGTWALSVTNPLSEGNYDVTTTVTDAAGNISTDTTLGELTVEAIPASTPTVVALTTSDTTPTISGNAVVESGSTLSVTVDGVTYVAGDGNLAHNTNGLWTLSIPTAMADDTYEVVAVITDIFGNEYSDTSSDELIVDTTDPVTPTVTSQITNNTSPIISGTATVGAGEVLTVVVNGVTYTAGDGNLIDNGDGSWNLMVPVALAASTYSVTATLTDSVGNFASDSSVDELIIDTVPPAIPTVSFQTTSNSTPIISGTAIIASGEILSISVGGTTYTAGDGNLVDNGDGTWDLTIPTALADGNYSVTATIFDAAGNLSVDATALELTVDTIPPVTPTVTSQSTNSTSPTINGTATIAPGDTLSVTVDGTTYIAGDGNLADNGDGTWTLVIPVTLDEGIYDVTTTVTDIAGNATDDLTASELIIDLTAPTAPGVTSQGTTDTTPVIEGTATVLAGEMLSVEVDGIIYTAGDGDLVDNGDGTWALTIPATNILAEALYQVIATVTDAAGNSASDPGIDDLVVDLTVPISPGVTSQTTNDTTPVIEGNAVTTNGDTLMVTVNGITYTAGDGNLVDNNDGTWALSIPTPLVEGLYDVTTTIIDIAGNTNSDPSSGELLIDTTPPVTPTTTHLTTSNTTPVLEGTANAGPGETLTILVDGVTYTAGDGNLIDYGDGTWALSIPAPLADGIYEVIATVTDAAGNATLDANSNELVIDTIDPVAPTINTLTTNNNTPVLTGTTSIISGELLTVTVNGINYTIGDGHLVVNSDGTWDLTIPVANSMADGIYEVNASITDGAGNATQDTSTTELLIDTTVPVVPTVTVLNTSDTTPTIVGTATVASGELLTVIVNGITYVAGDGNLIDNGDGTWALSIPIPLADATYHVSTTVTDSAGNASIDTTFSELIIDTTAPAIPAVVSQVTNNTFPSIEGTATVAPGETLSVSVDGVTYVAGDGNLIDNGNGTWILNLSSPLADNAYAVTVSVIDAAGNVSNDVTTAELIIDTTAPATPTVNALTTNNTTPTLSGTATVTPGEILSVTVDGTTYTAGDGYLIDNGDGTWALSIPVTLVEGTFDVTATVTDIAGNVSDDVSIDELIIDITAPIAPGVTSLTTADATPDIEGTATVAAGDILSVEINNITYVAGDGNLVDNGDGTWALTVPANDALAENIYQVVATVTDAAGNSSIDPGVDDLLIDFTAPVTPGVTSMTTNNTTPTIEGTATVAAGEVLSVEVNGITYIAGDGNLVDNGDGTWALTIPVVLAEGLYDVTATVTDTAGNTSSDPSSVELLIDTTQPVTPTVIPQITNNTTPIIEGTANAGFGETLSVTVDGVTYTAGDGNLVDNGDGTWALTIPQPLAEGTYEVVTTVIDAAGNLSTDTNTSELLIDTTSPFTPTVNTLVTNINTPVLSGTTSTVAGETLVVTVNGTSYTTGDGDLMVNSDGTWDLTIPATNAIAEGNYEVLAVITDLAGNITSDTSVFELTIDNTSPITPTVIALNTSNTTPTISGTATVTADETLSVTVDNVTYTAGDGNLVDNGDGTWDLSVPTAMVDKTYAVTVTVTDDAGNYSDDITTDELTIDTTAPVVPSATALNTSNSTPTIGGTATVAPGEILTVTVNGITYTAGDGNLIDNGDGTWTLSIPTPLTDGVYDITVTVTDIAGNANSSTNSNGLVVDTTAPTTPTVVSQNTSDTTPLIEGSAIVAAGETLTVSIDGTTYTAGDGYLVDNGDGTWTLSNIAPLSEGNFDVTVVVTDLAGNFSTDTTTGEIIIDLTAPIAPGVTSQTTSDATPVIEGTATVGIGETLSVELNGVTYVAGDGSLSDNGDGTWTLAISNANALIENVYQVIATVTDTAGNSAYDPSINDLLVDFTAPLSPGVTSLTTNDTTPVIVGTATIATGETLTVTVNGIDYVPGDGNLVINSDGTWTLLIAQPLTEGLYNVTATITDVAGNISSDPSSGELLIDTTLPITPTVVPLFTSDTTPVIEGTSNAGLGETLSVTVNGVIYISGDGNLVDNGDGTWILSIPQQLSEDTYEVIATVTDAAGNQSTDTNSNELVIDQTNPATPTVTTLVTNSTTPVLTGTTSTLPGEILSVTVNGTTYTIGDGNLIVNSDGTWILSIPTPLSEGLFDVTATITDFAGNSSSDLTSNELLIDTTVPVTPNVTPLTTSDATPIITITADLAPGETLSVTVNGVTYTTEDGSLIDNGDGTWSFTPPEALPDGAFTVTTTITDEAGNSSTSNGQLLIDTTPPATPTVNVLATSDTSPTITGTAIIGPGETLSVTVDGIVYITGDGNLINNGDGTWTLNIPFDLDVGTFDVQVTITDIAGNTTVSPPMQLSILQAVAGNDFDGDGVPDSLDLDDDNDGIRDSIEGLGDTDGDGQPDYQDLDSDNDGIADIIEVGGDDSDNDYRVDNFVDRDGNGLSDDLQLFPFELIDTDNDLVEDYRDLDSDNDGLSDLLESGGIDLDYNGYIDNFTDSDNDGADDNSQRSDATGLDTDRDGVFNRLDLDTDNDGTFDVAEAGITDDDNNGIFDSMFDRDLDGIPDSADVDVTGGTDSDNDGIDDQFDDSFVEGADTDGDGILDRFDPDANGDGFADASSNNLQLGQALAEDNEHILTGLNGNGCSIVSEPSIRTRIDPLLLILMVVSSAVLWRRSRCQLAVAHLPLSTPNSTMEKRKFN